MAVNEKSGLSAASVSADRTSLLDDIERQELRRAADDGTTPQPLTARASDSSTAFLDGLRGIAALCVFNQHLIGGGDHERGFGQEGFYYIISMPFLRTFYNGGSAAVSVFFVLSGFVLSQTSIKLFRDGQKQACRQSLMSAVVRRPVRLYLPAFAVTFLIAMSMQLPNNFYPGMPWCQPQESISKEIVHWLYEYFSFFNPFQAHGSDQPWFPYNLVMWTLPVELKGSFLVYALIPIWCFGLGINLWSTGLLFLITIVSLQFGSYMIACFVAGLALSMVDIYALDTTLFLSRLSPRGQTIALHVILVIGYYLISQVAVSGNPEWSLKTPGWYYLSKLTPGVYTAEGYYRFWQSYGAILFVYASLRLPWLQKVLTVRPLRFLGKVSFMLYVLHLPLFICIVDRATRIFGQTPPQFPKQVWDNWLYVPDIGPKGLSLRWTIMWLTALGICLPIANLATKFIDQPSVNLGKALSQRLGLYQRKEPESQKENRS